MEGGKGWKRKRKSKEKLTFLFLANLIFSTSPN